MPQCTNQVTVSELWHWIMTRNFLTEYYSAFNLWPFDIKCHNVIYLWDICKSNFIVIIGWILELWAKNVFCEVTVSFTSDFFCHQILSSASLTCSGHFSHIWRNSQKVVRRYDVHKNGTVGQHKYIMLVLKNMFCEVTVTLIFDHRPLKSIKVIPESKWTLTQNVKKFSQGDSDILC